MDVLGRIFILTCLFLISGCAKFNYVFEQGVGQYSLLSASKPNDMILDDPDVDPKIKEKIRTIEAAKDYFYDYWELEQGRIYSRTTLLDREAVTYLVIASEHDRIKAMDTCFWYLGCFPYLGFFSKSSADDFARGLENEGKQTYVRPVYAYSSLGYFYDRILSSFFVFEKDELVELIFHELYHTMFFIKNEVDLNENLAQFFGEKMTQEYLDLDTKKQEESKKKNDELNRKLVSLAQELDKRYQQHENLTLEKSQTIRQTFLEKVFKPELTALCRDFSIEAKDCSVVQGEWNNARFAAFMTYQKKSQSLSQLYEDQDQDLKSLQLYIESKYQQYKNGNQETDFEEVLFL